MYHVSIEVRESRCEDGWEELGLGPCRLEWGPFPGENRPSAQSHRVCTVGDGIGMKASAPE